MYMYFLTLSRHSRVLTIHCSDIQESVSSREFLNSNSGCVLPAERVLPDLIINYCIYRFWKILTFFNKTVVM